MVPVAKPPDRSAELIAAARRLFMEKGFAHVGMREITAMAGLSPVQAYRLGLAKEDLLAEISIQLSAEQLETITAGFAPHAGEGLQALVERYLLKLYESDIQHISIRKESAAYGWMWSAKYESRIITQVIALLGPVTAAMTSHGLQDVPDRAFAIWSLYYVGYRAAVVSAADAGECLAGIKGSLAVVLK